MAWGELVEGKEVLIMTKTVETASLEEINQLAEWLAIFQKLPEKDRIAIQYYIKGRIDAEANNVEIPVLKAAL